MKNGASLINIAAAWLFILMVAIAAAIVTIRVVNDSHFAPQKTVESYFDALKNGNGEKALGVLNGRVPGADAAVLDGPGLAKSQTGMKNVSFAETSTPTGQSKVTASYSLDGTDLTTDFLLNPGPKKWLFFDSWTIAPSILPVVNVSVVNANEAQLNGVPVNMPKGKNSFAAFYPGSYTANYTSALFEAPPQQRTISSAKGSVQSVSLATKASNGLVEKINATLRNYLDGCAKQAVLLPADCPMSASNDNRVISPVKWSIVKYPEVTVTAYSGGWVLAPLTVRARVEYKVQDLFTGINSEVKDAEDFGFTARLNISGNDVSVSPVVSY